MVIAIRWPNEMLPVSVGWASTTLAATLAAAKVVENIKVRRNVNLHFNTPKY